MCTLSRVIVVLSVVLIVGCAAPSTTLQNSSGHVVTCSAQGMGIIGTPAALMMQSDCEDRMEAQGYRVVDSKSVAPKASAEASRIGLVLLEGWSEKPMTASMVNGGGSLWAMNPTLDTGLLLSAAKREGVVDLMAYAASRRSNQETRLLNPLSTEISTLEINGRLAFQFEVAGYIKGGVKITYLYTIIEASDQLVVLASWSKSIDYAEHKSMFEGFPSKITGLL